MKPGGDEMRIKPIQMTMIMVLMMGLVFQSLAVPACGAESFRLRIESKISEVELRWGRVSGATSYDIYRSLSKTTKLATVTADTLKYRDRSVTKNESYTYWVVAKQDGVELATSNCWVAVPGNKQSSPTPPSLRATAYSTPYVELSWGSSNAVYYELEQKTGNQEFHTRAVLNKETKFTDYFVNRGSTYTYRVRAFNEHGSSDYSDEVTVTIKSSDAVPDVPTGFSARDERVYDRNTGKYESKQRLILSWRYEDTDVHGFKIERKKSSEEKYSTVIEAIPGLNTFNQKGGRTYSYDSSARYKQYYYYDPNVSTDTTYYYRIKAYNHNGSSDYSREVKVDTAVTKVPSPPSDLQGEAIPRRVDLTWSDNSGNEKGFYIERRADKNAAFSKVGTARAGANSYRDTSVSPNTAYEYRVRAFNDKGSSKYSNEVTVTTPSTPGHRKTTGKTTGAASETKSFSKSCTLLLYPSPETARLSRMKTVTTPPILTSSTIFLPARDIADLLDAAITWDDNEKKVTLTYKNQTIEGWLGQNSARINGSSVAVDDNDPTITPIIAKEKYLMLPQSFIQKAFKCTIEPQPDGKFIKVIKNK